MLLIFALAMPQVETKTMTQAGTRFAEVDGHRIAYELHGSGRPALVLVHGWSGDRSHWHRQIDAFPDHLLVLIDLPGHGQSDKPAITYSMDFLARAVEAVLDSLSIDKAILVGHSNGVSVIRQLWRRSPDRVLALAAVDGAFRNSMPPAVIQWMRQLAMAPNFAEVYAGMVEQTPTGALDPDDVARVERSALATPAHVHIGGLDGLADPSIWNDDPIGVPLLVIRADSPARAADDEEHVRRITPHVEYHLWRDVSHFIQLEKPEAFNRLLRSFVARVALASDR